MTMLKHECRMNLKVLLVWILCIGISCCGCILLFSSVEESMAQMAQTFAGMGSFSTAFGMDKISIATLNGYYSAEISIIFSLGGAMFSAMLGASLLSKEEEGHTSEFLYTLPLRRGHVLNWKYISMLVLTLVFHCVCMGMEVIGFLGVGSEIFWQEYFVYHVMVLFLQIEIGSICFLVSAICKKKQIGLALGLSVLLYLMDIMCRIVPDLKFLKWLTPYYYANAANLFSGGDVEYGALLVSVVISALSLVAAGIIYRKRDLAA